MKQTNLSLKRHNPYNQGSFQNVWIIEPIEALFVAALDSQVIHEPLFGPSVV